MQSAAMPTAPAPISVRGHSRKPAAKAAPAGDNRGELCEIRITVTENGFEISSSYEPKKLNPKQDRYSQMPDDIKMSFESTPSATAYVNKLMSGTAGDEAAEGPGPDDDLGGMPDDNY